MSGTAFTFLHFAPYCQKEKLSNTFSLGENKVGVTNDAFDNTESKDVIQLDVRTKSQTEKDNDIEYEDGQYGSVKVIKTPEYVDQNKKLSSIQLVILLTYIGFVNCMTNGILPSTLSYSCLPYGKHISLNFLSI